MKKQNKEKRKLKCTMTPSQDLIIDMNKGDLEIANLLEQLFKESIETELEKHGREISQVKNPIKISVEVKTRKKK